MAAGTAYAKRYAGGFVDGSGGGTPIDSVFLNAVEVALLQLLAAAPGATDGLVMQWDNANTRYGPALLLNKNIDPAAAIAKSKLDFTGGNGLVNADVAGAAAIARSKLDFGAGLVNADVATAAAIAFSKLQALPGYAPYRKTTAKAVNTTVAATDLLNGEITVAANALGTNGLLRLTAFGDWLQQSGGTSAPPRFQFVFGGTTLLDTGTSGLIASGATRIGWRIQAEIMNLGAANSQASTFFLSIMPSIGTSTAPVNTFTTGAGEYQGLNANSGIVFASGIQTASAVDTTAAKALVLNVINGSASASYETKLFGAIVEILG